MKIIPILYFSDILCLWAYIAQWRVDEVKIAHGKNVRFERHFCPVFGDTGRKIRTAWSDKGEYRGFNAHLRHAAEAFPEVPLNPDIWLSVRPASSSSPHLFLKAIELAEQSGACKTGDFERMTWAFRCAFFREGRDIANQNVQLDIAGEGGVDVAQIEKLTKNGEAFAALASDYQDANALRIQGSPSFVLNEGRQILYGNVGYRVIEANIQELLREPRPDQASWC
jgi:predicted DsbA family dithiol-disulfide isomerase